MAKMDWPVAAQQITDFGVPVTPEQLQDPEQCARELAKLGFSLRITTLTEQSYLNQVRAIGKLDPDSAFAQQTVAEIRAAGVFFTYQLEGGNESYRVDARGSHNTFLAESMAQCAAVALFNVARLTKEGSDARG